GTVPAGGSKAFTFVPNGAGSVQVTLMYDNASADLDLAVGFTDQNGDAVLIGSGTSEIKQFERCEAGVDPTITYTVVVTSFRGQSAFRLDITTTSVETTAPAAAGLKVWEIDLNHTADRLASQIQRIQKATKKH
ncbi:MAG TPA: hypothetical protein VFG11_01800, partial [Acidobacteriota bacterium]|nr:hypothetical protein [Acidobacteriota bacterium]